MKGGERRRGPIVTPSWLQPCPSPHSPAPRVPKGQVSSGLRQKAERAAGRRAQGLRLPMPPQGQSQAAAGAAGGGGALRPRLGDEVQSAARREVSRSPRALPGFSTASPQCSGS